MPEIENINADEKTSEIYSVLKKDYEDILYVQDFEISQEKLDFFTERHYEIYSKKANEIYQNLPESLVLSSGMFGGKTTLSFLLLEHFEKDNFNVEMLIADVMGEDYITARSYKGCKQRSAKRFGNLTNYREQIEGLSNSKKDVIFLDEFSFLDVDIVQELQDMCFAEGKVLILTGLNSSYLGQPLPAFCENSKIIQKSDVHECYSFVPGICEEEPLGTSTIRYVQIDNCWVLDFGLLPLVVSKEKTHVVHYAPAIYEHTAVSILQNRTDLLDSILSPSEKKSAQQNLLLEKLDSE